MLSFKFHITFKISISFCDLVRQIWSYISKMLIEQISYSFTFSNNLLVYLKY
jgi:hypothetical protein